MENVTASLPTRLLWTTALIMSIISVAFGIDCYKCTSFNGMTKDCDDVFDRGINTVYLIERECDYGYFKGTHCIKLKGMREDGTHIMVRDCSNDDWGSHCGDIRYLYGNEEQRIYGCLEACDHDGCNAATSIVPMNSLKLLLPFILSLTLLISFLQRGCL